MAEPNLEKKPDRKGDPTGVCMKTDIEIAQEATPLPIADVVAQLGLNDEDWHPYGRDKAKLDLSLLDREDFESRRGKLVLVSAITPTPAGEGKTTTTIGIGQAMHRLGENVCLALREPSLGPCLGFKGGATGGGHSQILPSTSINLHFTGDFHAITSAHNLLASVIDNHIQQGNELKLDPRRIVWRRVVDLNDRSLRNVVIGLGGPQHGTPRDTGFDITAASEIMAILCLADDLDDLRARIDNCLVGFSTERKPVYARELGVTGAMIALLKDALMPNLVQTLEGSPVLVHGGPFANIAHGCNSVLATRMSQYLADWTITEAGFGFDLGAEKFFDIKCRVANLNPAAVVLVTTIRALKMHGGRKLKELTEADPEAVREGLPNLAKHLENIGVFGKTAIVALNRFHHDDDDEIEVVRAFCKEQGVPFAVSDHFARGGEGAEDLPRLIVEHAGKDDSPFKPLYELDIDPVEKIRTVAREIYGARSVAFTKAASQDLKRIARLGFSDLPVCIAKTQSSLSDDPKLRGRPRDFEITVQRVQINSGAGFLVVLTGDILRMPGLPKDPQAARIDVVDGRITGLT
jgi:formate--tetrahydrofolate ligase